MTERPGRTADIGRHIGSVAAIVLVAVAITGVAWLLVVLIDVLLLGFAALVLAAVFTAMTDRLCRATGMKRGIALTLCVLAVVAMFVGVFWLFGAQLVDEFATIRASIPPALQQLQAALDQIGLGNPARRVLASASEDIGQYLSQAGGYVLTVGNAVTNIVLLFVGAIFIASDPALYRRGLLLLVPSRGEETAAAALDDASRGLRGWMVGQAVSSLFVALLTWAGLALIGVPAAGGLALVAGLLDVIPMVGPIIAGVPAVLLAFTVSPAAAGWTLGLFLLIQQLQGNLLQPMIQERAVNVPPAVLLFAIVAAGTLFGFIGVLLAAPLTVVVHVLVQRIYVRTLLGKDIKIVGRD